MTDPAKPETPTPGPVVAPTDLPKAGAPRGHPTAPPAPRAAAAAAASDVLDRFARRHRLRAVETLPFLAAIACFFVFPDYLVLGAQILATILFALSLDLILGYAGILTLGHVAFFGTGAYVAGLLAAHGWGEPISGLVAAALGAGVIGLASGAIVLRTQGLPLLMLTLVIAEMLKEAANKASAITGGADGLQGMEVDPVLGYFNFDLLGRTAYLYCFAVLLVFWWIARRIIHSSFGRSLTGIRENVERMHAIGSPVFRRRLVVYTVSAAMAGVSGALFAQTAGFVGLDTLGFDRSGVILIMLILGGVGRLYGAFIGVPLYMIAQDRFSEVDPVYWYFWIGLLLVVVVVFARGGVLGLADRLGRRLRRRLGQPPGKLFGQEPRT
jgi:branched-chain amino acid transport system permease protein